MPEFVTSDNIPLYYEIIGEGEPIVLINGIMMTTLSWAQTAAGLSQKGFRVILHDMRGQGKSNRIRGKISIEKHAQDLKELIDYLGYEKVKVVATSYGGKVALQFALTYPNYVEKQAIISSSHIIDKFIISTLDSWLDALRLRSGKILFKNLLPNLFSRAFLENNWDFLKRLSLQFEQLDFDSVSEMVKAFLDSNLEGKLSAIRTPTLIIAGTEDRIFPPYYSKLMYKELPQAIYTEIDAGHVSVWEKNEEILKLVTTFFGG